MGKYAAGGELKPPTTGMLHPDFLYGIWHTVRNLIFRFQFSIEQV